MNTPILGSSYVARSVNAADNRMVNLFPEIIAEGGKDAAFLSRAPGMTLLAAVGDGPIRGLWNVGDWLYVVSGPSFYRVDASYNATFIGTVANVDNSPVSMADNGNNLHYNDSGASTSVGTQIFIACNGPSYIYNASNLTFAQITDVDFPGAVTVAYLDGFFVFSEPNSPRIWVSEFHDGATINALDFARGDSPYNAVGLIVSHQELWVFGTETTEVWYDAGTSPFPFNPSQGATNELGCVSPWTIAKLDNTLFWLGKDKRGQGIVYKAKGYIGERVSTHAVEWQIQQYGDLSDAIAYSYQQDGHAFYVLSFPSHNATWVYDAATQAWHERAGWSNGSWTRHRSNCQAFFNNVTVIGDYQNGNIYQFDLAIYADNGDTQRWLRSWRAVPTGQNNLTRSAHHTLQLDCETGVGLVSGQGSDPQVMLRWSDDGGHTWSIERWTSIGTIGNYGQRAIWRRLGMTMKLRDRVYEVSGTDPVKVVILGAELHASSTNA